MAEVVDKLIEKEVERQRAGLELIPSENYVSSAVLRALGSELTNKYSEGYPGKRYYGGQKVTDVIEQLAIDEAKKLFRSNHANVQPHSGAPANEAVYSAWCEPGDTILAMDLSHGGHLTHGAPVTRSAKLFNFIRYKMKDVSTGEIDYDKLERLALQHKPKILLAGYSGYTRDLDYARFVKIGNKVGALLVADIAHIAGLIAAGVKENPLDFGFHVLTSTTHKTLRGPRGGLILSQGVVSSPLKAPDKTIENIPTLIDRAVFPGLQGGPHMNVIAAKLVALQEASTPKFKNYAQQVLDNASALSSELLKHDVKLVTGGTTNHMILIDTISSFGIDGSVVERACDEAGLTLNKNVIPDDTLPPFRPSGVRLGTPAITTRGLVDSDMGLVAKWIVQAATHSNDHSLLTSIRHEVVEMAKRHPLPSDRTVGN